MYLKSIEVHGFKSFATKLVFEFHKGITAIVGPNGSGKSNVADAVRWVLGEQSAKQLRGAKMEDVIFAGTEMRKPQGFAYVALTITNEDHKLNVPYEEVKIARRVYRSGESEYLLNGASCRLKDVQELLLDTGIGKEGYSIIGQGQIDKILSGKPEERRELFDEAAGIVKFKKRKAVSEKNLEEEQQNLTRIEDILSELTKQVGPLKEQSEKARDYLAYRDKLRNLDIHMFLAEYDRIQKEIEEITHRQEIAEHDLQVASLEFEKVKEEYIRIEGLLESQNKSLEEKQRKLSEDKVSLSTAEGEIKLLEEQIYNVKKNKEDSEERRSGLQEKMEAALQEKDGYLKEKGEMDQEHELLLDRQRELQEKIDKESKNAEMLQEEIEKCNVAMLDFMNENTDVKTEEQKFTTLLEQSNIKKAEITKRILENKTEAAGLEEVLEQERAVFEEVSDQLSGVVSSIEEFRNMIQKLEQENEQMEMEHRKVQKQYHIENSKMESLKNLTERYEGYGQSIKRVMEQKVNYPGIVGVVADIIRVKQEYELAVETALGGNIRNVVTDNEQTAKAIIGFLKKNRYGRATFLPLTNMKHKPANLSGNLLSEDGVIGIASKLVETEERYHGLVEYLLGRFVVVDHIDHAIALAEKYHHTLRIVTKEGDLLNPGGSMSGGAFKNNQNLLGRRREIEDAQKKTEELKTERDRLREEIRQNDEKKGELETKVQAYHKLRQELSIQQNTAKLQYDRAASDLEKNEEDLRLIGLEMQEVESEQRHLESEISKIRERVERNEEQSRESREHMEQMEGELLHMREELSAKEQENSKLLLEIQAKKQSVEFADANLKRMEETISVLSAELQEVQESGIDADHMLLLKEKEAKEVGEVLVTLSKNISFLEEMIQGLTKDRNELNEKNKQFLEKREELSAQKTDLEKECYRLESQMEKQREQLDGKVNYMWEQYQLTYHTAEENKLPIGIPDSDLKAETAKLKAQIRELGDVNVNAIEQYQEIEERYELLNIQHDDLIEAANVLRGIIEDLDAEMRKQFECQFGEIKRRFDHVFKELFGGGKGSLELSEDEDILEAGIRIVAQPPGKKLQNMMQMSGGEKALTAIALLFAIQSLKPSPFCLLDEIEAALDDSNVSRYAEYLHKLTADTQFIVITHRRGTMNASDILYGITMQEKGVSTLVSVNLLDEKEIVS